MPYLIKARCRAVYLRDGWLPQDPIYYVGPDAWVPFRMCPSGTPFEGDTDVEIRTVDTIEGVASPMPINAEEITSPPFELRVVEAAPSGRRGRRR